MRVRAYFLFELVAWPAAVWRAVLTVFACRVRAMQLSRQAVD